MYLWQLFCFWHTELPFHLGELWVFWHIGTLSSIVISPQNSLNENALLIYWLYCNKFLESSYKILKTIAQNLHLICTWTLLSTVNLLQNCANLETKSIENLWCSLVPRGKNTAALARRFLLVKKLITLSL